MDKCFGGLEMYLSRIRLRPEVEAAQLGHLLKDRSSYGLHRLFWGLLAQGDSSTKEKRSFLFREEIAAEQDGRNSPRSGSGRKGDPVYYVLSESPPANSALFEVYSKAYTPRLSKGERLAFKLRVNPVVSRRTGEKKLNGKPKSSRHDIVMDAQRLWLQQQLDGLGLTAGGPKSAQVRKILDHATDQVVSAWKDTISQGPYADKLATRLGREALLRWAMRTVEAHRILEWWHSQGIRHGFEVATGRTGRPCLEANGYRWHALPEKHRSAGFSSLDLSGEIYVTEEDKFTRMLMTGIGPAKAFGCGLMMIRRV